MSKRCCATNCFNSILYNRNIAYFSFPKHIIFAQQWARLAGREDLMNKSVNKLIKYFLCSEHFAANCFIDQETKRVLKRNLPHSIAMPTIFKNNLQETMQNANPRHSIEVHNIVVIDVGKTETVGNAYTDNIDLDNNESVDFGYGKFDSILTNEHTVSQIDTDSPAAVNENNDESQNANMFPAMASDMALFRQCRLCTRNLNATEPYSSLEDSFHLREFINRVMHNQIILADKMSQIVCKNCENNALLCLLIIQEMDASQAKLQIDSAM